MRVITLTKERLLNSTIVAGLAFGLMAVAPAAMAQSNQNPQDEAQDPEEATLEDVVIVGSRIRRDTYNSPSPVQVVTRDEATLAGFASATEVLQSNAVTGGTAQINNAYGGFVTDGGAGANTLSLRGLGATRTLVLLNGRRVSPAGSRGSVGSADLNVLPSSMIERIEILRDGASSVYGSDAVAGVVNIITRNNIEGVTLEAQYNATTDANGAGDQGRISAVGGISGDRWHLSGSLEYYSREELTLGDRDFTQCNIDGFTDGSDFIDPRTGRSKCYPITTTGSNGVTINTIGTSNITVYGNPAFARAPGAPTNLVGLGAFFDVNRFRPNSGVSTGLVGFEAVGGRVISGLDPLGNPQFVVGASNNIRDTFEERMLQESLISPVEVSTMYLEGAYDLGAFGNAEIYGEFLANRRESSQTGYRQLTLDYRRFSPLIPQNLQFSNFSADQGTSGGERVGVRGFVGFGNDQSEQRVDFVKVLGGIRGDFLVPNWRYDVYASSTTSDATYTSEQFLIDRMIASSAVVVAPVGTPSYLTRTGILGTTGVSGTVTCAVNLTDPTANCIPMPFLTTATIGGELPEDWVNYVFRPITGTTEYTETVISAGIDGPLFNLPAGEVSAFFGAEWREAEIDDTPSLDQQNANILNFSTSTPTRGTDSVWEVFGEVEVPLLANVPFAQALTLNASARYTDYDSAGDNTTYKVGLVYTPVDFVTLRATYGTSYRAPALFEQFLGATSGFISADLDPCDELTPDDNANVIANCTSEGLGLSAGYNSLQSVRVFTLGGAANNLEAETSDNLTVGIILQPELPSGWGNLSFATDYYEIEINNSVARLGGGAILADCYQSSAADFAANAGNCSFVTRAANNNALTVESSYINIATDQVKGLDYTLRYSRDIGPGSMLMNVAVTQFIDSSSQLLPSDPVRNQVGRLNSPEYSASGDIQYGWDNWRVRYGVEWIKGTSEYGYQLRNFGDDYEAAGFDLEVDDYFLHSASVQYRTDAWAVTAGVRNLLNETPPTISAGLYNRIGNAPLYSGYDYVGRSVFVNVSKSF